MGSDANLKRRGHDEGAKVFFTNFGVHVVRGRRAQSSAVVEEVRTATTMKYTKFSLVIMI